MSQFAFLDSSINLSTLPWQYYAMGIFIFGFIGWVGECLYAYYVHHKWVNRGFVNGPICPIYGVGAMTVTLILSPFHLDSFGLFLIGGLVCTVLEYITSYVMEKLWHLRWWDYSNSKFNLHGRVALFPSIGWGVLCVVLIRIIDPFVFYYLLQIPQNIFNIICYSLIGIFTVDFVATLISTYALSHKITNSSELMAALRKKATVSDFGAFLSEHLPKLNWIQRRHLKAFPQLNSFSLPKSLDELREKLPTIHKEDKTTETTEQTATTPSATDDEDNK